MNKNEVYEAIRFQIISNVIQPGKIFNEKDLMEQFGIGRTPLRDVLLKLEEEALIRRLPRHGHMVMPVDVSEVRELVELRRELEGFAGSLAAERISQTQLQEMRAILQEAQHEIPEPRFIPKISEYFDTRFSPYPVRSHPKSETGQSFAGPALPDVQDLVSCRSQHARLFPAGAESGFGARGA